MSRKRPRTTVAGPRSICHWTNDDEDNDIGGGASLLVSSRQQSTLHAFFVTGSPTLRKRKSLGVVRSKNPAIPTTPRLTNTLQISGTIPTVSPSVPSPPSIPSSPPKKKQWKQVYLDCGQSRFGQQLCELCGMLYMPGVLEDTKAHAIMCKERCLGVVWRQVRGQRTHFHDHQGDCIVSFLSKSPVLPVSFESVYRHVAQDLGMEATTSGANLVGHTIWLYLRNHRVIGFVATEPISNAFYLVACPNDKTTHDSNKHNDNDFTVTDKTTQVGDGDPLWNHADRVGTKAILGIAIMWTHSKFRNQGIATALVDSARHHAFFGMTVPTNKLAFSSPTQAGWTFGKKYCGNPLLYDYCDTHTPETTDPGNIHQW